MNCKQIERNMFHTVIGKKEKLAHLIEEFLRGAIVADGLLLGWGDCDGHVGRGVEVILVPKNLTGVLNLFARVPF